MPLLRLQLVELFLLAVPVACIAWTFTNEQVFHELHQYCVNRSQNCRRWYERKFFYLFTCEYCFSHYVVILFLIITRYKLLYEDWRGYLLSLFALVWIANQYMSIYNRLRLDIKSEQIEIKTREEDVQQRKAA